MVNEPPGRPYHRFLKNRAELYTRLEDEATAPARDVAVTGVSHRVFLDDHGSDLLWNLVLSMPEGTMMRRIDDVAKVTAATRVGTAAARSASV